MIKYTHIKLTPAQVLLSIIGIGIVLTGLLFAVYQMKYGNFGLISNAADPCAAYTKQKPFGQASGVIASKSTSTFVWNMNGDAATPKVVVPCAGTSITRQAGGAITFADLQVGDHVDMMGWYGDTTKTTVLPTWIRDNSTSLSQEWGATVASVNPSASSFMLNAVDLVLGGVKGSYQLNVKYTPSTKCYTNTTNNSKTTKPVSCSSVAVGQTVAVTGLLDDQTRTVTANKIGISNLSLSCPNNLTLNACNAAGCSWYACTRQCLPAGTQNVCPTPTP